MNETYANASQIFVWLGCSSDTTTAALRALTKPKTSIFEWGELTLRSLTELVPSESSDYVDFQDRLAYDNSEERVTADESRALKKIFATQWYSRLWTLQELILAKRVTVISGPLSLHLSMDATNAGLKFDETEVSVQKFPHNTDHRNPARSHSYLPSKYIESSSSGDSVDMLVWSTSSSSANDDEQDDRVDPLSRFAKALLDDEDLKFVDTCTLILGCVEYAELERVLGMQSHIYASALISCARRREERLVAVLISRRIDQILRILRPNLNPEEKLRQFDFTSLLRRPEDKEEHIQRFMKNDFIEAANSDPYDFQDKSEDWKGEDELARKLESLRPFLFDTQPYRDFKR